MISMKVGFIGGGHMARAIIAGMVQQFAAEKIFVADRNMAKRTALATGYKVQANEHFSAFIDEVDVIVLAIKPQGFPELLLELAPYLKPTQLMISIAAGVTIDAMAHQLNSVCPPIVRAMPNMPSSLGLGATGLFAKEDVGQADKALADKIMRSCGITVWVEHEALISAVVAVAGSSPAYFFYLLEIMEQVGVELGLSPEASALLTKQAVLGSATLAASSDQSFTALRQSICSPKGTTEQAINSFIADDFANSVKRAMLAAVSRDQDLATEIRHRMTTHK